MILLVTCSDRAHEFVETLKTGTGERVEYAANLEAAASAVRRDEYAALVIDEAVAAIDPEAMTTILRHAGSAVPVFLQFAISGSHRMLLEVKAALRRRQKEYKVALESARSQLRDDLRSTVTGILLSSELALADSDLSPHAAGRLREVHQLAQEMQRHLRI